ncbi:MAG TPA: FMN-binding protein, partial [Candidatus Dormibacteraeota bacterium]
TPAPQPAAAGDGPPAAPAVAPSPSPSPTPSGQYRDGSYTGEDVGMRYGDVQVQVKVAAGRITDVVAVRMPSDRERSAYISQVAGPMLHDEVLQAQSAQIDSLSGATYTSDAYAQSVQAALDQAHA